MTIPSGRFSYTNGWSVEEKFEWLIENISARDWLGMSGTSLLDDLRDDGFIINRPVFYEARRQALEIYSVPEAFSGASPEDLIPRGYMTPNTEFEQSQDYMYRFVVNGYDRIARTTTARFFQISTDEHLTFGEAEAALYDAISGDQEFYGMTVSNVSLFSVYTRI